MSCSTPPGFRAGEAQFGTTLGDESDEAADARPTRAELEDEILRFDGHFNALLSDGFRALSRSPSQALRRNAMRLRLLYSSASLDIALGALPEQNLLDMVVFVELIRDVFRDYWLPKVFKEDGRPAFSALEKASKDLEKVAAAYLTPGQISELRALVDAWHRRNPNIIAVETVRLPDFSAEAGARAIQIENEISGLLAPINRATAKADKALLLGERALYFAQRAPFLLRMQSTATVQDVLEEAESSLSGDVQGTLRNLQPIVAGFRDLVDLTARHPRVLEGTADVLGNLSGTLGELRELRKTGSTGQIRSFFLGVLLIGTLLILFSGIVYVLAKLTYDRLSVKRTMKENSPDKREAA